MRAIIYVRSLKEFHSDMLHADRLLRLRAIKCKQIGGDEGEADAANLHAWASRLGMYRIGARLDTRDGAKTPTNRPSDEIAALKSAVESLRSDIAAVRRAFHDFVQLHEKVDGFDDDI
jgi:hypothetical protein